MTNFILFCLATVGMTNILVDSSLFAPVRHWLQDRLPSWIYDGIECHQCMGTWCGFICGYLLLTPYLPHVFLCGCAGSFLASLAYLLIEFIVSKTELTFHVPTTPGEEE